MEALNTLLEALTFYNIEVLSVTGRMVKVQGNYEIEVEANGLYKLLDDGYIVAPFDELNELCRFILA